MAASTAPSTARPSCPFFLRPSSSSSLRASSPQGLVTFVLAEATLGQRSVQLTQCAAETNSPKLLNSGVESKPPPITHCAIEQSWLPLARFAFEERSVRVTQCVIEASSIPIARFGNEQTSTPMPQCGVGTKSCYMGNEPSPPAAVISMGSFRLQQPKPTSAYEGIKRGFPQRLQI